VLQRVAACCSVLQRVAVCCSVLQRVAACCSVLQCVAVCCSVLQRVAVCCSVLQYVAVCCSVYRDGKILTTSPLQTAQPTRELPFARAQKRRSNFWSSFARSMSSRLKAHTRKIFSSDSTAMRPSSPRCVVGWCSVLQCVVVCCSVWLMNTCFE